MKIKRTLHAKGLMFGIFILVVHFLIIPFGVSAQEDTTPPQLTNLYLTPATIDTSIGEQVVKLVFSATDSLSGVGASQEVVFHSPSGQSPRNFGSAITVSGTRQDGTFEIAMPIRQFAEPGTWQLLSFGLIDALGNRQNFTRDDLIALGFTMLDVENVEDTTPPSIIEFSFSPDAVDVSTGDQAITVTARITDNLSGFSSGGFWFYSDSGQPAGAQMNSSNRIFGNAQDGIYQTSMVIPQLSENGIWHFTSAIITDQLSNQINFDEQDFIDMGFPTELEVVSIIDTDDDGIPDDDDACPDSDTSETVVIDGWDSGVDNVLLEDGCTISDLIAQCADGADNHGEFVSAVSHTTNHLKKIGEISGKEKGKIQKGAAKADIP